MTDNVPFVVDAAPPGPPPAAGLATIDRPAVPSLGLFGTADPVEVVASAKRVADALVDVVEHRQLYTVIEHRDKRTGELVERKHIEVTAWTLLGSMLGVFPIVIWTKQLANGWEARVEARRGDQVVGSAESECRMSESRWKGRASNDLRSMAQTRATRRALAGPLGFIIELAGYEPTLAEDAPVTAAQHRKLAVVVAEIPGDPPQGYENWHDYAHDRAVQRFGVSSRSELTVREMADLIDEMEQLSGDELAGDHAPAAPADDDDIYVAPIDQTDEYEASHEPLESADDPPLMSPGGLRLPAGTPAAAAHVGDRNR